MTSKACFPALRPGSKSDRKKTLKTARPQGKKNDLQNIREPRWHKPWVFLTVGETETFQRGAQVQCGRWSVLLRSPALRRWPPFKNQPVAGNRKWGGKSFPILQLNPKKEDRISAIPKRPLQKTPPGKRWTRVLKAPAAERMQSDGIS